MNTKKAKLLVLILFFIDVLISTGLLYVRSYVFKTEVRYEIFRIVLDLIIISLAITGVRKMKNLYLVMLIFTGVVYLFISAGIFMTEGFKLYGLTLLIAGLYYLLMFFLFVHSKGINAFFEERQQKFQANYNNQEMKME